MIDIFEYLYIFSIHSALGMSQATVSRLINSIGSRVLRLGRGKATLYAIARDARGDGHEFPVFRVTETGDVEPVGTLLTVQGNQYWWAPVGAKGELFNHLPWFIQDMRPDGFMGRAFAQRVGPQLRIPDRLQYWTDEHVLAALSTRGEDLMGNIIVGQESLGRYLEMTRQPCEAINANERLETYPRLVESALKGDPPGSSAAGEQPKFAALIRNNGELRHVLVKFSSLIATPVGRRWADLIVCEHLALNLISERGIDSAPSQLLETEDRYLLEVTRFDRQGRFGRLPMLSLFSIDAEFFGHLDNWIAAASRLESSAMLSRDDAADLRWLSLFSSLIANSDQHFGNVSLITEDGRRRFSLAPAYDILPMLYRPQEDDVPGRPFKPGIDMASGALDLFPDALDWAIRFWEEAAGDTRITEGFRGICRENLVAVRNLAGGPQLLSSR
ncbi:MAG: type II toxin-antitoxin system HipA family toxin YjjJ [bacterium]|nr:type II toxin-antitoxin system HipA family toxin YjjJ [bacterium]MDT8365470.1 type II toxin-antitoxin system HipA family toxin YjjJ [bacterium]